MNLRTMYCLFLCLAKTAGAWAAGTPQGTAFTYQGVLKQSGAPVTGTFDIEFRLFDVPIGGTALGAVTLADQTVSEGYFTAVLDFGLSAFDGGERWLEVQADAVTLTPRQKISAAPYALFALTADGPNLTNLNASNLASGSLDAARLPDGGNWALASTLTLDSSTLAVDPANNRVGIGTTAPGSALHVSANDSILVLQDSTPFSAATPSVSFWDSNANEIGRVGYDVLGGSPNLAISNGTFTGKLRFLTQNIERMTITDLGAVGIGTTTPTASLHVRNGSSGDLRYSSGILNLNRGADGTLMSFTVNGPVQGSITISGSTVSYNGFMGSHYAWVDGEQTMDRGALVRLTGENRRLNGSSESDVVYGIEPTASANDPACLGAYLGIMEPDKPADLVNPHLVAAVGNGEMLVVDSGTGDIEPGDYLISADAAGCAMKDDAKRFPVGHVIARAAQRVDWSTVPPETNGRKVARMSVFFENFVRAERYREAKTVGVEKDAEIASLRAEKDRENAALQDRIQALEQLVAKLVQSQ